MQRSEEGIIKKYSVFFFDRIVYVMILVGRFSDGICSQTYIRGLKLPLCNTKLYENIYDWGTA